MPTIRTAVVAAVLALAGIPAFAGGFAIDLPRLEFPAAPEATRACADMASPSDQCSLPSN